MIVLILIAIVIHFLLKVAVSLCLYVCPVLLLGLLGLRSKGADPPPLPSAVGKDDPVASQQIEKLLARWEEVSNEMQEARTVADDQGVSLTANSDYTRYAAGRLANKAMERVGLERYRILVR